MEQQTQKTQISKPTILCILLLPLLLATTILLINRQQQLNKKKAEITDLSNSIAFVQSDRETLAAAVSEQAASIEKLQADLELFATPEEYGNDTEAFIEPDTEDNSHQTAASDSHPNLYAASKSNLETANKKTAYLTFDDGPSNLTPKVLDILDEYNAKATFFVIGTSNEEYKQYYQAIVDRGHTLAMHSLTHNYKQIYASVDAFLSDYEKLYDLIYENTKQVCTLFRFPGGSKNAYNKAIINDLMDEMERRGFIFYDWNVSCGDGSNKATQASIYQKVMNEVHSYKTPVILMHDGQGHDETIAALPDILKTLQEEGYTFAALTPENTPVQFPHN